MQVEGEDLHDPVRRDDGRGLSGGDGYGLGWNLFVKHGVANDNPSCD